MAMRLCGLRLPCIEYVALLWTLLSTELTQVITDELSKHAGSSFCDADRETIACPLPCYCSAPAYRSVRCDDGGLTSIPAAVWSVVPLSLNLSFNNIADWTVVDAADTHVACLRTLILSYSGVARIQARAFERLRVLRQLMLDHNDIKTLHSSTFVGLRRLELLDLSHNRIVALPPSLFDQLKQLKVLRLAANRLSSVPASALQTLTQLMTLDLSDNPLTSLHRDVLASTQQLVYLNVSGTRLTRLLPGTILPAASTLRLLDMSRCSQLTTVPVDAASLTRLQRLSLPARTCRCDVINFRSVLEDVMSRRQRPRPSLFCGEANTALDVDVFCSGISPPTAPPQSDVDKPPLKRPRDGKSYEPLPYDPKLGWYTAAVLSGLLFAFIACVGLEKAEKHLMEACMARHGDKKKHLEHLGERRLSSFQYQQQQQNYEQARTSASICTVADFEVGVDSYVNAAETTAT